jgi:hypothetical protein
MEAAAANGHTAICAYLHAEQCPWDEGACDDAAHNGHVDTLRWLHEHGCGWNVDVIRIAAAESGSVDTMMYLQQQDDVDLGAAALAVMLNVAGGHNHLAAAQWLRAQGAEWPGVLSYIWQPWSGETLAWARAEGCTSPTQ